LPLPLDEAQRIGHVAFVALIDELLTWPKPGLVSHVDSGSHDDMDCSTFHASAVALRPFFVRLASAGATMATMEDLRAIGIEAEHAMLVATGGVNTHRGAIFALGLLCAAAAALKSRSRAHESPTAASIAGYVAWRWGNAIVRGPIPLHSHGSAALRRFGAGGARAQAAAGFPHVVEIGLPALRRARTIAQGEEAARVETFFSLLAAVEDTNLLHRGGAEGLDYAREVARQFLETGGVGTEGWEARALEIHLDFVGRRLSPGGCADLLAATILLDRLTGGL
jgi:triphosphoribosyl-dephospho-CoA synthase